MFEANAGAGGTGVLPVSKPLSAALHRLISCVFDDRNDLARNLMSWSNDETIHALFPTMEAYTFRYNSTQK
jgi:hypothetical protein